MQELVHSVEWRNDLPLYLEEAEIEDVGNLKLDWSIDMTDLEIGGKEDKSVIMDDASIKLFGGNSFCEKRDALQQGDETSQGNTHQPLIALDNSDLDDENEEVAQNATDADAQSSQGIEGYGRSSALD